MRSFLIVLVALASLAVAAVIAAAGPGYRFGFLELSEAMAILRSEWLVLGALAGAGASTLAFVITLLGGPRSLAPLTLLAAIAAGVAGYVPISLQDRMQSAPFLHDVTTDTENPPRIIAGAQAPRRNPPDYLGDAPVRDGDPPLAELQRSAYPDLRPLQVEVPPEAAERSARMALAAMRIEVLDERRLEDGAVEIEGVATTPWFGFKDDFVVRVRGQNGGSRIDLRSKSRIGGTDLGTNAGRIRDFVDHLGG